jgi:heme/copper-type cytochrome/quinol oxidase subunit 4
MDNVVILIIVAGVAILSIVLVLTKFLKLNEKEAPKSDQDIANEMTEELLVTENKKADYNEEKEVGKD